MVWWALSAGSYLGLGYWWWARQVRQEAQMTPITAEEGWFLLLFWFPTLLLWWVLARGDERA